MKSSKWVHWIGAIGLAYMLAACGQQAAPLPNQAASNVHQGWFFLPGQTEKKLLKYEIVDGLAIFEGDIILGPASDTQILQPQGVGIKGQDFRWPGRRIPFVKNLNSYDAADRQIMSDRIDQAIAHWEQNTDIDLVPKTSSDLAFVEFGNGTGCLSFVGRTGKKQPITLSNRCGRGAAIHEIGHAVGLFHEQTRNDRNSHVKINFANIQDDQKHNFDISPLAVDIGPYDFGSIMHYGAFDFCKDPCPGPTIETIPAGTPIGQRTGLSVGDIAAVHMLYPRNNTTWSQNSSNISGGAESGDHFGNAVASGDFNGDGKADLAVGVPDENVNGVGGAGAVNVIYGAASGLASGGNQMWHQDSAGVKGGVEANDHFGAALAAGDFNGDGFDDLAIGVPDEDILREGDTFATSDAGMVNVLYGSSSGLRASSDQIWHQDIPGIGGGVESGDHYGAALAAGDFNGDGRDDLAVGVPGEDLKHSGDLFDTADAGAVSVIMGSSSGLVASADQFWSQSASGIAGDIEAGDHFGAALASGDFNGDGKADLAIGVPDEDIGSIWDAGAVNVLYGGSSGLSATGDQFWSQGATGIAGDVELWDHFGAALTSGDFDGDGRDDLAIGVPDEDVGSTSDAGAVNVIYGTSTGLSASGDQLWTQDSSGIQGAAEGGDHFGAALAAGDFNGNGREDLAIGVPFEDVGGTWDAGAVNMLYGGSSGLTSSDKIWDQDGIGLAGQTVAEGGDLFGKALAAGDFNGDGKSDLAIGVPGEDFGSQGDAGAVNILDYLE